MSNPEAPLPEGDWFFETDSTGFAQGFRITSRLHTEQTPFQHLEVVDSDAFGRVLILDGALQTSERDEFMYHEMLVHVALMSHPAPRRVLIVGGGDGGALRHVLQHPIDEAVQVEIDSAVVESCRKHLPKLSDGAFDHPRARLIIGDGIEFMKQSPGQFDVIIIDSTDPVGPAVELFESPFYTNVFHALADDGLMVAQSNSPLIMSNELRAQAASLRHVFPIVQTYLGVVLGYPGSLWSYTIGSKRYDASTVDQNHLSKRVSQLTTSPRYYTPAVHNAAFALPSFIAEILT